MFKHRDLVDGYTCISSFYRPPELNPAINDLLAVLCVTYVKTTYQFHEPKLGARNPATTLPPCAERSFGLYCRVLILRTELNFIWFVSLDICLERKLKERGRVGCRSVTKSEMSTTATANSGTGPTGPSTHSAVDFYIQKMLSTDKNNTGMKVLLFDDETLKIMGLVCSRHLILERGVFLHDYLKNGDRKTMKFLSAVVFVRPTRTNIQHLKRELEAPKYQRYRIYFSNSVSDEDLKTLAAADHHEVVESIQEVFADFYALDPHIFTMNFPRSLPLAIHGEQSRELMFRAVQGTLGLFLSLKVEPVIR